MENIPVYEELEKRIEALEKESAELKQTDEELKFERAQLLSIFGSINQIIYVADPNTYEILYVNDALKNTLLRVGQLVWDFQEIVEMDINPVIVYGWGEGCMALDVKMTLSKD